MDVYHCVSQQGGQNTTSIKLAILNIIRNYMITQIQRGLAFKKCMKKIIKKVINQYLQFK
jgi:hypothetical protein